MRASTPIRALAAAVLLAVGTAATAVEFTDAVGDDKGPGNYTYPTDGVYRAGSFDIVKASITRQGANVEFAVDVNSTLDDPWGMGVGFAVQMIFIFVKNGAGGHSETPPGVNAVFAKGHEWNRLVVLSPQRRARVLSEAAAKTGAMASDILVPNITRGAGRTIRASLPLAQLGGDGNVDAWGYQVVMQSNEGFPSGSDFLTRKVNEFEGQHRFGGGNDADCDPHIMDLIEGPGATQAQMLAHECAADGKPLRRATLQMIRK